jgi:hypothetical protein
MSVAHHNVDFAQLDDELRLAPALGPELFRKLLAHAGARISLLRQSGRAVRIEGLIEAGAWTEAALAAVELELPAWKVRRLVQEDGMWLCSLTRQPNLPIALDDPVETCHETLPLAVLRAFIEACRCRNSILRESIAAGPQVQSHPVQIICCDNFA